MPSYRFSLVPTKDGRLFDFIDHSTDSVEEGNFPNVISRIVREYDASTPGICSTEDKTEADAFLAWCVTMNGWEGDPKPITWRCE